MANYPVEVRILPLQLLKTLGIHLLRVFSFMPRFFPFFFSPIFAASWVRKNYNALQKYSHFQMCFNTPRTCRATGKHFSTIQIPLRLNWLAVKENMPLASAACSPSEISWELI